jgi:hypothetical protein
MHVGVVTRHTKYYCSQQQERRCIYSHWHLVRFDFNPAAASFIQTVTREHAHVDPSLPKRNRSQPQTHSHYYTLTTTNFLTSPPTRSLTRYAPFSHHHTLTAKVRSTSDVRSSGCQHASTCCKSTSLVVQTLLDTGASSRAHVRTFDSRRRARGYVVDICVSFF